MTSEIIAIEDWVLPQGTSKAARNHADYIKKLSAASARTADPTELLLTWGYHQYFHGTLTKAELDAIRRRDDHRLAPLGARVLPELSRPEEVRRDAEWVDKQSDSVKKQLDLANGHFWEQGWFAVAPLTMRAVATPQRVRAGLEFVERYYHANGVTLGANRRVAVKSFQEAQNAVMSDSGSPFRFYFIADGKSVTGAFPDEKVAEETEKFLSWGQGMTAYLPKQVKLFADGAIFSQAMQVSGGYKDGHKGEWMMDLDFFARSMRVYWDLGYQIHVHVNGDAGLDMVLDQLELNMRAIRASTTARSRPFRGLQARASARIKRLGAIVSGNAYYPVALADNYRSNGLDPERADSMVRMGDVERAGISYSFHSDMPMAPGQPLFLMWSGVNRVTNDGNLRGPTAGQPPGRPEGSDPRRGLLAPTGEGSRQHRAGKLANFTILADNPVTGDPAKIKDIAVWGTVHEGRVLPVARTGAAPAALGPVMDASAVAASIAAARDAHEGHDHEAGDICTTARMLAEIVGGIVAKR